MRAPVVGQRVRHRAAAGAAADDDDVVAFGASRIATGGSGVGRRSRRSDPSAADRRWRARGSSRARGRSRIDAAEVAIHRLVAADVAEAREDAAAASPLPRTSTNSAVRLERDDAVAAEQLRQPQALEAATESRASSRASRPRRCRSGTPPSCSWRAGRGPRATTDGRIAVRSTMIVGPRLPARCSQWMPSSKNASPPAIVSSLRQSSAVFSRLRDACVKCANTISPIAPSASSRRSVTASGL